MDALLHIALSNAVVSGIMAALLLPPARWMRRPALTHAICVLILLKLLTPPFVNLPVTWNSAEAPSPHAMGTPWVRESTLLSAPADSAESDPAATAADATVEVNARPAAPAPIAPPQIPPPRSWSARFREHVTVHWRSWLLASWVVTAVLILAVTLVRVSRLGRALRDATVPTKDIAPDVALLCKRLGVRRVPGVRFIAGRAPPMLMDLLGRPELVIPIHLWDRLDGPQRRTLLLHELAHLRRRDHWVRRLELLATCVYWWHPATWLARAALREAEEQCCDAWVVWAMPESASTYMTTLLDTIDFLSHRARPRCLAAPVLASGMGQFHNLKRRLTMVRERTTQRRLGGGGLTAVILLGAVALPVGAKLARADDRPNETATAPPATSALLGSADPPAGQPPAASDAFNPRESRQIQSAAAQDEVARLEAELAAARNNVERLRQQLQAARSISRWQGSAGPKPAASDALGPVGSNFSPAPATAAPRSTNQTATPSRGNHRQANLGYIAFNYQPSGAGGTLQAVNRHTNQLMWQLDVPLNADSVIQCYGNENLLIRSADGYTREVTVEDGRVTHAWAPGVETPAGSGGVNPFGIPPATHAPRFVSSPNPALAPSRDGQDQEKRLERIEQSLRQLTEAVDRLTQDQQRTSSSPRGR
jgi:beta-lactamase regulating signal transducer with metallopeptidase domain